MKKILSALKTSVFAATLLVAGLSALPHSAEAAPILCAGDGFGCLIVVDDDLVMVQRHDIFP